MPQFTYNLSEHLFIKMKTFKLGNQAFTGCHYVLDVCQGIKIHLGPVLKGLVVQIKGQKLQWS